MRRRSGPVVLILWALGWLALPFLALFINSADIGLFIVTTILFGPLAILLARSGSRDDGRQPSQGFARRSSGLIVVAFALAALALVAGVVGNPSWLLCFWIAVFSFALARSWGFRLRTQSAGVD